MTPKPQKKTFCPYCKRWFPYGYRQHMRVACYSWECVEAYQEDAAAKNRNRVKKTYHKHPEKWKADSRLRNKQIKKPASIMVIKKCLNCGRKYKTVWHPGDSKSFGRCDMCKAYEYRRYNVADYGAYDVRCG